MLDTRIVFANLTTEWTVPSDLPYFQGHFPGQPIFPAVGIVDACLELVRKETGNPNLNVTCIPSAKFTSPISPGQKVQIKIAVVAEDEWQIDWSDPSDPERKFASLRLQVSAR